ncbi:Uma2 family endonuclease [Polyangium aurulentum]|uniref:Uma2 family endonuclease n=1 Tax=Polyangium aurulentum TaxID=2567896 RepID=UPI0010AE1266|nr:Uma2 family endonuclease [Polyangium aurulentum]UQA61857.1 Uma2 family endonuclease [Polyangium aurulentum]
MDAARRLATYDDLLNLSEDVRAEVISGHLVTMPAPRPRHANVQRALIRFVGGPFHDDDGFGGPGGWWIFPEVDVELAKHDIVRPDLSGWRREHLPEPDVRPIRVVPDWICEVLSPSNEPHDRVTKKRLYAQYGVRWYWIVNPEVRTLEAYKLIANGWLDAGSFDETDVARIPPFEAVELPVGRLFLPRTTPAEG